MLRVSVSLALLSLVLTACGTSDPSKAYEQENFIQNQTYSRSFKVSYKVACDAGRRALLSQGYSIDKSLGDTVTGHKNFVDQDGRNTQITFNVNCAPDSTGPNNSQVFANAIQDGFSLKKSSTAASVGVSILGSVSLPFMSSDDALVKTSSVTVTRPAFYSGFFDLLHQYLAVAQLEQPQAAVPSKKPAALAHPPTPVVTPTVPLTPENTGVAKPTPEPKAETPAPAAAPKAEPAAPTPGSSTPPASTAAPASTQAPAAAPTAPAATTPATDGAATKPAQ